MKKIILLLSCVLSISLINAGVSADTIVDTPEGLKEIKILKVGDPVFCCNPNLQREIGTVATIQEIEVASVVEITTTDGLIIFAAPDQKFFVTHKWVQANQLTLEDVLFTRERALIGITSIRHVQQPMTLRFITIDKNPTYWAAENGILMHNGAIGATVGVLLGASAVQASYGVATYVVGATATALVGPVAAAGVVAVWGFWTYYPALALTKTAALAGGITLGVATGLA